MIMMEEYLYSLNDGCDCKWFAEGKCMFPGDASAEENGDCLVSTGTETECDEFVEEELREVI